jgi:hypothetical protein
MNALKIFAVGAESVVLAAVGTVACGLVAPASPTPVVLGTLAACLAVEATRLPLVMRAPSLGPVARCGAIALALCASTVTFETLALGVEATLDARALGAVQAEERLAEAQAEWGAAKTVADRLAGEVEAARRHVEKISREPVALANNPTVAVVRNRKGWRAPGSVAANTAAQANARAQDAHSRHLATAEADLAAARSAAAAGPPMADSERGLAEAKKAVAKARAESPLHRLAAAIYRTDDLPAGAYATIKGVVVFSLAGALALGTLLAGALSVIPPRGARASKLSRALRAWLASRRKTLRRIREAVRTEYRDRTIYVHVPVSPDGLVLDQSPKVVDPRRPRAVGE